MDISLAATSPSRVRVGSTVLVPIGSTEPHGSSLPLDTATEIAVAAAEAAARMLRLRGVDVVVAPPLSYGSGGGARDAVGSVTIRAEVLTAVLVDMVRSAGSWARRVVLVNGQDANAPAVCAAVARSVAEGYDVTWTACGSAVPAAPEFAELSVSRAEMSLMLHLRPWQVRRPRKADDAGQSGGASADEGREVLDSLAWFIARDVLAHAAAASS